MQEALPFGPRKLVDLKVPEASMAERGAWMAPLGWLRQLQPHHRSASPSTHSGLPAFLRAASPKNGPG